VACEENLIKRLEEFRRQRSFYRFA